MSNSPTLFRQRNFQWYWSLAADGNEQQQMYSDIENDIIEEAYNKKQIEVEIDGDYIIDLERLVQYRKGECHKQFTIKRTQLEKDRSTNHFRIERFGSPVNLVLSSSSSSSISEGQNSDILFHALMKIGDFPRAYFCKEISKTGKMIADVIKAAAEGIVKQEVILGRMRDAESLSQQLLAVEHFGANIVADIDTMLPMEIGNILVNMYTRETFWYKLINRIMRDLNAINIEEMRSIGPFCYLLRCYLSQIRFQPRGGSHLLCRGLNLEDKQIQEIIQSNELIKCLSFTSTSTNRKLAELLGNTLLIIELDVDESGFVSEMVDCSSSISDISAIPDEDEFLIRPPAAFYFIKYEDDAVRKKHIIYLKTSK
ncbi:unnamed protein product [Rotaria sp. Silwood2]|nr:unnamed protein product [Rotaria sp. Silwood2]